MMHIFSPPTLSRSRMLGAALGLCTALVACSESTVPFDEVAASPAPAASAKSAKPSVEGSPSFPTADAAIIAPSPPLRRAQPKARLGVVTAGDIDDTLNLGAFLRYQKRMAKKTGLPQVNTASPVRLQFTSRHGGAAAVNVSLFEPGATEPFYTGQSGVDGLLTVFPRLHGVRRSLKNVEVRTFTGVGQGRVSQIPVNGKRAQINVWDRDGYRPDFLDLVFVFDTTGSMGDELAWLTKEFGNIVSQIRKSAPGADLRFGLVAYRDQGDAYVVKNFGFTKGKVTMQRWLRSLDANGGGDYPEAADAALMAAAELPWRRGLGERLVFHVADAPSHKSGAKRYLEAAQMAAGKNVQIFGLGASGVADEAEFLMRQAALATNGRYLFLTDDSGVGNAHAEPNVACYRVTRLKSLLTRVITSEMTGKRQEAGSTEVIRTVGNYRNGTCKQ